MGFPEQRLRRLRRNENLRRDMSQNNLQDIANFDWNHIIDKYIEVYRHVLMGGK